MALSSPVAPAVQGHRYRPWVTLTNTTLGVLMASLNASIVIISLPAIFRGIHLDPLEPANVSFLLWILMGFLLVTSVLVTTFGRLGDIYGRVRIYNAGFAVFTAGSIALALTPLHGVGGALWLIVFRLVQGVGAAMLFANSLAIITDAFPPHRRGTALGANQVAALTGSFVGLVAGGLLASWSWRAVFWISVPVGIIGTVWSYISLEERGRRTAAKIDGWGNATFAAGLIALLAAITYGIQPYGGHSQGWTNPWVLAGLIGGVGLLVAFCLVEQRVAQPMVDLRLFRIRAFAAGNAAGLLASIARGGLQFMLIIWLQGIWLPLHGYRFEDTPLWAGIYLLPLTAGFLVAGPVSGFLSDRYGARAFATGGLVASAVAFGGLLLLPVNFGYGGFAALLLLAGLGSGLFSAPNASAIMNSVPAGTRGQASGVRATFQNSGQLLSIGIFFSLMIAGLASTLPHTLASGLTAHGVPAPTADRIASLPPVGSLFAAFLGYNPMHQLLGPQVLHQVGPAQASTLTGQEFFPHLISGPFHTGLVIVFVMAIVMSLVAAGASLMRGGRYVHTDDEEDEEDAGAVDTVEAATGVAGETGSPQRVALRPAPEQAASVP